MIFIWFAGNMSGLNIEIINDVKSDHLRGILIILTSVYKIGNGEEVCKKEIIIEECSED